MVFSLLFPLFLNRQSSGKAFQHINRIEKSNGLRPKGKNSPISDANAVRVGAHAKTSNRNAKRCILSVYAEMPATVPKFQTHGKNNIPNAHASASLPFWRAFPKPKLEKAHALILLGVEQHASRTGGMV